MIKSAEIRKIVNQELKEFLAPYGYVQIKVKGDLVATFVKKDDNYYYDFSCHTNKYNDYQLVYGFSFGIDKITELLKDIDQSVPLSRSKYQIHLSTIGLSPGRMLDPFNVYRAYKFFGAEADLLTIVEEIKSFYKNNFIPFCEKYSRFEALDKLMNSPIDFWEDSTGKTIPVSFFHVTRLVVARLANNPDYDIVVEKNFQALEELWKRDGGVYDRNDAAKPEVFAAKFLRNKPI